MAYPATGKLTTTPYRDDDDDSHLFLKLFALLAGIAVGAMIPIGIWLAASAQGARDDANAAAAKVAHSSVASSSSSMPGMVMPTTSSATQGTYATPSYAGIAPANADAIAMRHAAVPAELPAAPAGDVAAVRLDISHATVSIAPGIRYDAWTFGGSAPGPVIHVRQGQTVR